MCKYVGGIETEGCVGGSEEEGGIWGGIDWKDVAPVIKWFC